MLTAPRLNLALFLARLPLGAYFAIAGYNKIFGMGVSTFVDFGMTKLPTWVPHDFGRPYLTAVPFVELASGLFLIIGLLVRTFSFLQALMLISFTIAMHKGYTIAHVPGSQGPDAPLQGSPFDQTIVFIGLALCLSMLGSGEWHATRVFRRRGRVVAVDEPTVVTTSRGTPIL